MSKLYEIGEDLTETGYEEGKWTELVQDCVQWRVWY